MPTQSVFDQLYVIGDSLSDSGGIYQLSSQLLSLASADGINTAGLQALPISPYAGKFSNGPVLPEYTAELLGAKLFNFSFGGAEALGTLTFGAVASPAIPAQALAAIATLPAQQQAQINAVLNKNINLAGQMTDFVTETSANKPSSHSALMLLMGLNDLQALAGTADPNNPQAAIAAATQVAAGIVQADLGVAHTAFSQGIGTVIFETLPAVSFFPFGQALSPALRAIGDAAVQSINQGIQADAAQLRLEGHDVRVVDLASFTVQISANPATFGFQNLAQPTLLGVTFQVSANPAAPPPDQTAFFDAIHATTKLHDLMAQFVGQSLGVTVTAHNDAYVVAQDHSLGGATTASVLQNDDYATTASLLAGPQHGTLNLLSDGSFSYTPVTGFSGVDSFTYSAVGGATSSNAQVLIYVVPTQGTTTTTLNLLALNAEEQIAATYTAFFGRGADAGGLQFWVGQFAAGLPTQGASTLFANIASSFGISNEAKALYPFLANPSGASSSQISSFLDTVYNNLFNRSSDSAGLAYWTGQIQQTLAAGKFVGSVLVDIISGTQVGPDVQALLGKVAVNLEFVHQQVAHNVQYNGTNDQLPATALLHAVTSDFQTVLVGIKQADVLVAAHA